MKVRKIPAYLPSPDRLSELLLISGRYSPSPEHLSYTFSASLLSVIRLYHNNKQQQQKHHHDIAIKMSLSLPTNESLSVSLNDLFAPVSFLDLIVAYAFGEMFGH